MSDLFTRRRFTVEEYHRMGEAGILAEDDPVELIAGEIVVREPIGSRHAGTVNRLNRLWTSRLGERAVLIEVADSTLAVDRRVRMPLYARAAIREAWLLDLTADRVEVYRAPTADGYQQVVRFERGQRLTPEAFPDLMVTVENLLG